MAAAVTLLVAACAPSVTTTGTPPSAGGLPSPEPRFARGRVEHRSFVAEAVDPKRFVPIPHDPPVQVVATVGQIADVADLIGGDRVVVTQIVPGADDPHRYVPTPGDVASFARADVILYNGLFLEGQMGETFGQLSDLGIPTVPVSAGFDPDQLLEREYSPGEYVTDPHVWFDPSLWGRAAANVAVVLAARDPAGAETYSRALADVERRLDALSAWGAELVTTVPADSRVMVTSHDAFGYFGRRFGLEVVGLQGLSTEAEAGTRDVEELAGMLVRRRVPAVFVEASVSPEALTAVAEAARAAGHDVRIGGELFSDTPGVRGTAEGSYMGMVIWNLATVVTALGGEVGALPREVSADARWDYEDLVRRAVAGATRSEH